MSFIVTYNSDVKIIRKRRTFKPNDFLNHVPSINKHKEYCIKFLSNKKNIIKSKKEFLTWINNYYKNLIYLLE